MKNFIERLTKMSLSKRVLLVALGAVIPIIGIMAYQLMLYKNTITTTVYQRDLSVAYSISVYQDELISQGKGFLIALSQVPQMQEEDSIASSRLFGRLLKTYPYYSNIAIDNSKGDIIASALPYNKNINVSQRAYFEQAMQTRDFSVGDYEVDYITKMPGIDLAYPILDNKGQVKEVIALSLSSEWIGGFLKREDLPPNSSVALLDHNGIILARFPNGWKVVGKQACNTLMTLVRAKTEWTGERVGIDDTNRLYAFVPVNTPTGENLFISIGVPASIAFAALNNTVIYDGIELLALVLAVFIIIRSGSEWLIIKPLNVLISATKSLSNGEMNARTGLEYDGQVGQLARAFDEMAAGLENERKKLYALIDELPAYMWVQSSDSIVRFANKRFIGKFGDPVGKLCFDLFNSGTSCEQCIHPGNFEVILPNGITLDVYQRPFLDTDGSLMVLKMGIDITDKKTIEEEIIRLDRLNLVGEMAATIAHEIRNPMTTVRGFLQMLQSKDERKKYKDYYSVMIEELDRANSIITEYLSLTRTTELSKESCSLNSLINQILPLIVSDATGMKSNIATELADIPNLLISQKEIGQLLLNLVRNGLEAMHGGGTLIISTFIEENDVVLAVKDQGSGIDPAVLDKLGTPFVTTKKNGTGLGLSVCYAIAHRHNAIISVNTGPNGTTFYVRFKVGDEKETYGG